MDKNQHWIRLQVTGGAGLNFVLPANPNWKVSQLQQHMIQIYNEIASNQSNSFKAIKVKSIKRNGFYIASSLKVGNAFVDWDQVTCNIVTRNQSQDNYQGIKQVEIKEKEKKKKSENKQQKEKKQVSIQDKKPNKDQAKKDQADSKKQAKPQIIPEQKPTKQDMKDLILKNINENKKRQSEEKKKQESSKKEKSKQDKKIEKNNKQKESKEENKEKKNQVQEKKSKYKPIRVIEQQSDVSK